jgi:hypothetical protein
LIMLNPTTIALAAAIGLGSMTLGGLAAHASSADEYGAREGGFKVGPLGQWMGTPASNRYLRGPDYYGYGYAPGYHRVWRHEWNGRWDR